MSASVLMSSAGSQVLDLQAPSAAVSVRVTTLPSSQAVPEALPAGYVPPWADGPDDAAPRVQELNAILLRMFADFGGYERMTGVQVMLCEDAAFDRDEMARFRRARAHHRKRPFDYGVYVNLRNVFNGTVGKLDKLAPNSRRKAVRSLRDVLQGDAP